MVQIKEIVTYKTNNSKPKKRRNRKPKGSNNNGTTLTIANAPVAKNTKRAPRGPRMRQAGRSFVVSHREYISDVTSANAAFSVTRWACNPGLASSFPWLATIANRYESYIFDRLDFIYEPICPTTTAGSILMSMDYDAGDAAPSTKVQMMAYQSAVRGAPWDRRLFSSTVGNLHKFGVQRYTRSGALGTNEDIKTYDVGAFFMGSQNTPATATTLGELYVEYTVRFFTPQIPATITSSESNRVVQQGVVTIPKVGIPTFASTVLSTGPHPHMWLDPRATTTSVPAMLFNFATSTNGIFTISGTNSIIAPNGVIRKPSNLNYATSAGMNLSLVASTFGFGQIAANDRQLYHYLFRPSGVSGVSASNGGGILPLFFERPAGDTAFVYNVSWFPVNAAIPSTTNTPVNGGTWDFPNIVLPILGIAPGRMHQDAVNTIVQIDRVEDFAEQVEQKPSAMRRSGLFG